MIFKLSLPSVGEKTLGKELFAECCICDTRQRALCRVSKKDTRQRNSLPSVKNKTLGKELLRRVFSFTEGFLRGTRQRALCRVPEIKHSAKNMALGKEPNSGNVRFYLSTKPCILSFLYSSPMKLFLSISLINSCTFYLSLY